MNSSKPKYTNSLANESSPYLLQHAHNPVNWYPWGKEALEKAKSENKLIIISIGYAACHWCHVMEHESFENEEVANYMNQNFICIKVDREERPDIDQIYMNAVQLIAGRGGWPLNCIALPDGRPIYGGTYFKPKQWLDMLKQILDFANNQADKAEQQAKTLTNGIQTGEMISMSTEEADFSVRDLDDIFANWKINLDYTYGGHKRAPKFPLPVGYQFLQHYHYLTENADASKAVTLTLDKMAEGGIYDQIGGGFARYSVDKYWKAPHFEKMLYDNAQLVGLYSSVFKQTKDKNYKTIVRETLEFINRELKSADGGFYSSLDADSEGEEGMFYVWSFNELKQILGKDADLIIDYYNVKENGNWENSQNILFKSGNDKKLADRYKLTENELSSKITKTKKILLEERAKRIRPALDDKIITSWNALMQKAYVDAFEVFENSDYLDIALQNAEFIITKIKMPDNRLYRNYKNGKASINAFLDDYAFTIAAFISLYQATFDEKWLHEAKQLTDYANAHFYNKTSGMFYYTSDVDPELIARKMEISDNVIPASNSEMAKNLFLLGKYFYNDTYLNMSQKMLNNVKQNALDGGAYYANWDILMAWFVSPPYEVVIIGKEFETFRKEFNKYYLPNVFLSGGKTEGKLFMHKNKFIEGQTTIYVCQNKECKLPVTDFGKALKQIKK
ncbi:MAG: thioredoxin domain-containing protein [Bacteroidetes bacterium]|nr:thioredoxin domain-containing protein [Bacteroidota bacterium]MBT6685444.1 thioredoxin domain-containing protein [Bacteroidota bacterium]MBT7144793.1 thioredoxin domain-containing protein [Bacteroidota bacterium]MBT7490559.1 thioredoxin domain-containing protein [Bacteroidota bacterium]